MLRIIGFGNLVVENRFTDFGPVIVYKQWHGRHGFFWLVDEFFQRDVSKIILDQCAIKQFHKLDGMNDEIADVFGLNHARKRFVQDAIPGSDEKGYSQALLGIDGEWRGMEVRALPAEKAVIDYDSQSSGDVEDCLPSMQTSTSRDALSADDD